MSPVLRIVSYDPKYLPQFIELNQDWIKTHFKIERTDREQLERAEETILKPGGEILFLLEGERVLATCALVPHGENAFELAKMAVAKTERGKGYGDRIMIAAIKKTKERGASELTLLSNTLLEPAITLYHKHGFKTVHLGPHPDYERCNIEMKLSLSSD